MSGYVVLFDLENSVSAVFLPYCISTPIVYEISTTLVYFSNSATAGPKLGIKKD